MTITKGTKRRANPGLGDQDLREIYRYMLLARTLSERAWLLTRQGRVFFTMPCDGQEAGDVGSAFALDRTKDFIVPYARDLAAMLVKGMTARDVMLNLFAKAADPNSGGRQMPMHWGHKQLGIISMGSPVGVSIPKAAGVALASKIRGDGAVTIVYFGEGAASEGDVHEGMAFAGVHQLPVVFFCNNNGWATSVPTRLQAAGSSIAVRAQAYGFPGVMVDGCDPLEVYKATKSTVKRARSGGGPTLIEAKTLRLMPHTSSDDQARYRSQEELDAERLLDPLPRFRYFLLSSGVLMTDQEAELREAIGNEVEDAIEFADAAPAPDPKTALEGIYAP
jgi:2-oxoisovalerate dehydrogenase E1 component alpha subunit